MLGGVAFFLFIGLLSFIIVVNGFFTQGFYPRRRALFAQDSTNNKPPLTKAEKIQPKRSKRPGDEAAAKAAALTQKAYSGKLKSNDKDTGTERPRKLSSKVRVNGRKESSVPKDAVRSEDNAKRSWRLYNLEVPLAADAGKGKSSSSIVCS